MSLNTVQPSYGLQKPSRMAMAGAGDGSPVSPGDGNVTDTVRLSDQGKMMSKLSVGMPPTPENVRKLSARLAGELKILFRQSAIDTRPGVRFEVDSRSGEVSVGGNRPDAPRIAALIGSQPDIERQIQDIAALSRHVVVAEQGADSRLANRMAQNAAQISSVIADYASRFSDRNETQAFSLIPDRRAGNTAEIERVIAKYAGISGASGAATNFSLLFNGADVQVHANGKPWISSTSVSDT